MDLLLNDSEIVLRNEKEIGLYNVILGQDDVGRGRYNLSQLARANKAHEQE